MKLIRLEAKGFKSFAERIVLNFDGNIVGIVGPNGSGKSNINDAIKWVLGEQSSKSLRGDSMEDVIFAGSKTVPAMDKAEVSLTFDNSDHQIKIPAEKIVISRVIERGKGSNYYINGEIGQLKTIRDITMETGISKSSLAIISQGTISEIAQATPEERRNIFEEAAGTSVYKKRKEEAIRKLERTTEALEKMKTIIHELEKQLGPLSRQAEKAKTFIQKSSELKEIEIALIAEDYQFYLDLLTNLESELEVVLAQKKEYEHTISELEIQLDTKNTYKLNLDSEIIHLQARLDNLSNQLLNIESLNSKEEHTRKLIISGEMKASTTDQLKAMHSELMAIGSKVAQLKEWESNTQNNINDKRKLIEECQRELNSAKVEQNRTKQNQYRTNSKLDILLDYQKNKSNLFQGTKTVMNNRAAFAGVQGIVSELINVPREYQLAIETILQNTLQQIVVDNPETAIKAIKFLKDNNGGRATFIPLNTIVPKQIRKDFVLALETQGAYINIASKLVEVASKHNILKEFLLGNIIVAKDIDGANHISQLIDKQYMVVTLDGDLIRAGGVISGGQKTQNQSILNIEDQVKDLEAELYKINKEVEKFQIFVSEKENALSEEQALVSELYIEQAKIREKLDVSLDAFNHLKVSYESRTNKKIDLKEFKAQEVMDLGKLQEERSKFQQQLKVKRTKVVEFNDELAKLSVSKNEFERMLRELVSNSSEQMNQRAKAEFYIDNSLKRLTEEYEMTIENAITNFRLKIEKEKAREIVSTLRREIKELGYINMDALKQYDEVKERYDELKASEEELDNAQQLILSAIAEMDQIMIIKFEETIKGVQQHLSPIFTRMFGGGEIELRYTNPQNILETGIDVVAQPPGKSVRNLKLFSGGEKSLIAISLLFAILRFKPLPLCILDEVEAALDEANVVRYANFLQELKGKTQFMVITHRVGTMERVDQLFGVTMQQRGVTSIFTVKLENARQLVDKEKKNLIVKDN